jgi:hypothetical protein
VSTYPVLTLRDEAGSNPVLHKFTDIRYIVYIGPRPVCDLFYDPEATNPRWYVKTLYNALGVIMDVYRALESLWYDSLEEAIIACAAASGLTLTMHQISFRQAVETSFDLTDAERFRLLTLCGQDTLIDPRT